MIAIVMMLALTKRQRSIRASILRAGAVVVYMIPVVAWLTLYILSKMDWELMITAGVPALEPQAAARMTGQAGPKPDVL